MRFPFLITMTTTEEGNVPVIICIDYCNHSLFSSYQILGLLTKDHNSRWTVEDVLGFFSDEIYPLAQDAEPLQPDIDNYTGSEYLWASQQIFADFHLANDIAELRMQQMANSFFLRPATVNDLDACLELQGHGHTDRLLENPSFSSILAQGLSWVACMAPPPGPTPPLCRHLASKRGSAVIGYILVHLGSQANFNACVPALPVGYHETATSAEPWYVRDVVVHRDRRKQGMLSAVCTNGILP